jgi:predicted N-acyltransferase
LRYSYRIYDSIQELDLDSWQQIFYKTNNTVFMDIDFLSVVEKSMQDVSKFWYIIFYDQSGSPHACTCLSSFKVDPLILAHQQVKKITYFFRKFYDKFLYITILFCGLPISLGQNHLLFIPEANQVKIIELLEDIMQGLARTEKASLIVCKEFNISECQQIDILLQLGYCRAESLPMNHFQPSFLNFDHYYNALKSNYRKHIKKSINKFKSAGLHLVQVKDSAEILRLYTSEVHQLYEAVANKSKTKLEILPIGFFQGLVRAFPDRVFLTVAYRHKKIVGFIYSLHYESVFYCLFCGFDLSLSPESDLYFNLAYGALEQALSLDLSSIEVGQTADKFKSRMGCYQKPLYFYVKGVGFLHNWAVKTLFKVLFPTPLLTNFNNVFREPQSSRSAVKKMKKDTARLKRDS